MDTQSFNEHGAGGRAGTHAALATGLAVSVGVWIAWFLVHMPAVGAGPAAAIPGLALVWLALAALVARLWGVGPRIGGAGGLVTGLVGLLLLGSMLAGPHEDGGEPVLSASALWAVPLYLGAGAGLGALGALIGRGAAAHPATPATWSARLAWSVAASFAPLILIGGMVTSTESGLAVPDWPSTFGANMFLYPTEQMQANPRVFFEHMHRLFGTLVGLATLVFVAAVLIRAETRRRFGPWAAVLFVAVCVQGYLGGQRVVQQNPYIGAVHGAVGQILLAFAATLALWMSPSFLNATSLRLDGTRRLRLWATTALHVSILQLLLGALFRHLRRDEDPGSLHVIWTHAAFSIAVVGLAVIAGAMLIRTGRENSESLGRGLAVRLRALGASMHGVVGLQFVLGWVAFLVIMTADRRGAVPTAEAAQTAPPVPAAEALAGTLHQANGALLLVLVMMAWAWARRLHKAAASN